MFIKIGFKDNTSLSKICYVTHINCWVSKQISIQHIIIKAVTYYILCIGKQDVLYMNGVINMLLSTIAV